MGDRCRGALGRGREHITGVALGAHALGGGSAAGNAAKVQSRGSHQEKAKLECTVMVMTWCPPLRGTAPAMPGGTSVSILAPSSCCRGRDMYEKWVWRQRRRGRANPEAVGAKQMRSTLLWCFTATDPQRRGSAPGGPWPPPTHPPTHRDESVDLVCAVRRLAVLEVEQAATLQTGGQVSNEFAVSCPTGSSVPSPPLPPLHPRTFRTKKRSFKLLRPWPSLSRYPACSGGLKRPESDMVRRWAGRPVVPSRALGRRRWWWRRLAGLAGRSGAIGWMCCGCSGSWTAAWAAQKAPQCTSVSRVFGRGNISPHKPCPNAQIRQEHCLQVRKPLGGLTKRPMHPCILLAPAPQHPGASQNRTTQLRV